MTAPAWMPLYVADYLADTGHLTMAEHGAYMLLIMHYWQNGGLPDDEKKLARICRASPKEWAGIRDTLADLFVDGWKHKRIDEEIANTAETIDKRSTAGRTAGLASAAARRRNVERLLNETPNDGATIVARPSTPSPSPSPKEGRKEERPADAGRSTARNGKPYAFAATNIRLDEAAFKRWETSFPHLALRAELEALDHWAGEQSNWFVAVASALAKRERQIIERATTERDKDQRELTPEEQRKRDWEGII